MGRQKIIYLDVDGTCFEDPQENYPKLMIDKPKINVINYIKQQQVNGAIIILWTLRTGQPLQEAIDALKKFGIIINATVQKYFFDEVIDDRSIHPDTIK